MRLENKFCRSQIEFMFADISDVMTTMIMVSMIDAHHADATRDPTREAEGL